ncbi:hypothetical protein J6590_006630 [Homalodisca vitripennis]|nr:hypothetical protein J6590_006630 [Homalodisca vitripennis]
MKQTKNDKKKHPIRKVKKESVITLEDNKKSDKGTCEKSAIRPKGDSPMKKKEQIVFADDSADDDYEEGDAECLHCTGLFSEDRNGEVGSAAKRVYGGHILTVLT